MTITVRKFDLGPAWMNVIHDYEAKYPNLRGIGAKRHRDINKHRKMLYGFKMLADYNTLEFEDEKAYAWFMLRWS